jgi:hypothetical protein
MSVRKLTIVPIIVAILVGRNKESLPLLLPKLVKVEDSDDDVLAIVSVTVAVTIAVDVVSLALVRT